MTKNKSIGLSLGFVLVVFFYADTVERVDRFVKGTVRPGSNGWKESKDGGDCPGAFVSPGQFPNRGP